MKRRTVVLRSISAIGALIGYGCLAAFLALVGLQTYRWFREGEWPHFGMSEGMRMILDRCCVKDGDAGRIATFLHWLDSPVDWLGVHKVIEVVPASLALFAFSIAGNCLFIYCLDRLKNRGTP
jgi:hypothetical protein